MLKVMTVVGTRPELIRLSRVIHRLDETVDHVLVHTGQNYDYSLNEVFFDDLGIRKPDHMLGVDTSSLGAVLGGTLIAVEGCARGEAGCRARPRRHQLVHRGRHGETPANPGLPHGSRQPLLRPENVPEETNRRLVDHVSDFNLVYTEHARRNLLAEGLHPRRIIKTGSPMREVLDAYRSRSMDSTSSRTRG
jgi:UDP-N-acetylglucosamine 2-epimerase